MLQDMKGAVALMILLGTGAISQPSWWFVAHFGLFTSSDTLNY